jgi:glutamine synthetase
MSNNERLRLLFCDHLSLARGKYLPATKLSGGDSRFCQSTFALTYDKELVPAPGSKMLEGLSDMIARFEADDVRRGWEPNTMVAIADLFDNRNDPLGLCSRSLLKRTVREWQQLGYNPQVGLELEAYAFQRDENGQLVPLNTPGAYVYSTGPSADPVGFIDAIWNASAQMGFQLEYITSEFDAPQFEFTLKYDDAVKAVDDIFLFRLMAREIAFSHGILLTFMPKPIEDLGGSGLHVNFSFTDSQGGNAIGDSSAVEKLSDLARGCVAGLMKHHCGMAALVAPTVNSYERLKPASLSGYWCNWAIDHRGVTTRLSAENGAKSRIEHRMGDASANPYTLVATVLQAAKLGVTQGYELPPHETGDCLETQDAKRGAPLSLTEALQALSADTALVAAVGDELVANHIAIKEVEIQKTADLGGNALRDYYIHYL